MTTHHYQDWLEQQPFAAEPTPIHQREVTMPDDDPDDLVWPPQADDSDDDDLADDDPDATPLAPIDVLYTPDVGGES